MRLNIKTTVYHWERMNTWRVVVEIGDAPNIMERFWEFRLKPAPEAIGLCVAVMCQTHELVSIAPKAPNEG